LNANWLIFLAEAEPRVFGLDAQTFWQMVPFVVNFLVLAFLLSKFLFKPVKEFMARRSERILSQMNQAKEDLENANELRDKYEQQLKGIEAERTEILEAARKTAETLRRQIVADADKEARERLDAAEADIAMKYEHAQEEMRLHIIQVSSAMTERFLLRNIGENDQNRLYDETLAELEEMAWRN